MYSHKQKDSRKIHLAIAILAAALVLAVYDGGPAAPQDKSGKNGRNTPRTPVPKELVGRWEGGSSGSSGFLSFTADGYFESGSLVETAWIPSSCKKTFFSYKNGTMTVQGNTITLHAHVSTFESSNSCDPKSNYKKPGDFAPELFKFQIGADQFGIFMARYWPDGQMTQYRKNNPLDGSSEYTGISNAVKTASEKPRDGLPIGSINLEEKILGIWYSEIEETNAESKVTVAARGTTEYFRNGTSSSVGEIFLRGYMPDGGKFEIMYTFTAKEEWMLRQQRLSEKLVDMKTMPKYLEVNGERINVQYLDPAQREQLPKIEDMIPKGIWEEAEIIAMEATVMRVKSKNSMGAEKIIAYYKRDKHFVLE